MHGTHPASAAAIHRDQAVDDMANQAQMRELRAAVESALADWESAEGYRRSQREALNGGRERGNHARPLEFDESGFPIAQKSPGFLQRVRRLISDG